MDAERTAEVLGALTRAGVRYKVVGGVALNLLGLARATEDLDVFVAADEDNIGRLRTALRSVFDDPCIEEITAADLAGDYPAIQYVPPSGDFHIDLLARLGEAFTYEDIETQELVFRGVRVPAATPRMLYRMKKDTVRAQDWADAQLLREQFGLEE
jgi:hypothetical protein